MKRASRGRSQSIVISDSDDEEQHFKKKPTKKVLVIDSDSSYEVPSSKLQTPPSGDKGTKAVKVESLQSVSTDPEVPRGKEKEKPISTPKSAPKGPKKSKETPKASPSGSEEEPSTIDEFPLPSPKVESKKSVEGKTKKVSKDKKGSSSGSEEEKGKGKEKKRKSKGEDTKGKVKKQKSQAKGKSSQSSQSDDSYEDIIPEKEKVKGKEKGKSKAKEKEKSKDKEKEKSKGKEKEKVKAKEKEISKAKEKEESKAKEKGKGKDKEKEKGKKKSLLSSDEEEERPARRQSTTKRKKSKSNDFLDFVSDEEKEEDYCSSNIESLQTNLKPNHHVLPIWTTGQGHIVAETFSPLFPRCVDFIIAISEPIHRTHLIHEYKMTKFSLYAAVAIGLPGNIITSQLNQISKNDLPNELIQFINNYTHRYGKAKLVLHKNHYFIESPHKDIIETFLLDPQTLACINRGPKVIENAPPGALQEGQGEMEVGGAGEDSLGSVLITEREETVCLPENLQLDLDLSKEPAPRVAKGASEGVEIVYSVEVASEKVEEARKRAIELDYPLLEEYDFRKDTSNTINIELKPTTSLRDYQEKCLCKIFGNGRARSGIVALPCGAGKTLVGITAAATIKKPVFVLCTSSVAVEQWRHQFKLWTTIEDKEISKFTSSKEKRWACVTSSIVISTYSMLSYSGKRAVDSETILQRIKEREWGLLILDEVQVVPAKTFRTVLHHIHAHTKIGLSATLVREDAMISDLHFLIGPKVYEADWLQLAKAGHLAKVQCAEVWCPMTPEFYSEYSASGTSAAKKRLLYMLNPNKFRICESLVRYHEARGDKILVFSDNIYALVSYAEKMGKPYIAGSTKDSERMRIFSSFKYDVNTKTIFISKVGDNSIDLPEANVILQISSHYGSRRQEAQRLGRVLRPKSGNILREVDQFDAFFYSLVSQDTLEMQYSTRRQQFLIDQGYAFKMITDIAFDPNSFFTKDEEKNLLHNILTADDQTGEIEVVSELDISAQWALNGTTSFSRAEGTLSALSGADGLTYTQFTID